MSTGEEASKAVGGFIDVMKSQPLSLALVVMNCVLLYVLWSIYGSGQLSQQKQMELIFSAQEKVQEVLTAKPHQRGSGIALGDGHEISGGGELGDRSNSCGRHGAQRSPSAPGN